MAELWWVETLQGTGDPSEGIPRGCWDRRPQVKAVEPALPGFCLASCLYSVEFHLSRGGCGGARAWSLSLPEVTRKAPPIHQKPPTWHQVGLSWWWVTSCFKKPSLLPWFQVSSGSTKELGPRCSIHVGLEHLCLM